MGGNKMTTKTTNLLWHDLLDVAEGGLFVTNIESHLWGTEQIVHFVYNPHVEDKSFRIIFKNCTRFHWEYYGEEDDERDETADVIGFDFRLDQHGQAAILHTDLFEISIHYGSLEAVKDW
jgi:hypothetical protein